MKKKPKIRNPMAGVLANPCFKKQVVRDRTKYSRKGRAAAKQFAGGSFILRRLVIKIFARNIQSSHTGTDGTIPFVFVGVRVNRVD
jgi:hypothetical protein